METYNKIQTALNTVQNSLATIGIQTIKTVSETPKDKQVIMRPVFHEEVSDLTKQLLDYLVLILTQHKQDIDSLIQLYKNDQLWRLAIRKMHNMDDTNPQMEGAFWYNDMYRNTVNGFLKIYLEDHPMLGLEKVLEIFEYGYGQDFIELHLNVKEIIGERSEYSVRELLGRIECRFDNYEIFHKPEQIGSFIAILFSISPKAVEFFIEEHENSQREDIQSFITECKNAIERLDESNPYQIKLELKAS